MDEEGKHLTFREKNKLGAVDDVEKEEIFFSSNIFFTPESWKLPPTQKLNRIVSAKSKR